MRPTLVAFVCACVIAPAPLLAGPDQSVVSTQADELGETYRPADIIAPVDPAKAAEAATRAKAANSAAMNTAATIVQASLDAWRARNFEGWIAKFAPDVQVITSQMRIIGRKELRAIYRVVFDAGFPEPKILKSGWTGERVFVVQEEFLPGGHSASITYSEYEVTDGLITMVYGQQM